MNTDEYNRNNRFPSKKKKKKNTPVNCSQRDTPKRLYVYNL